MNNLLAAINLAGAAEAIALAQRLGLDAARTLDVIEQSSGQSWIGSDRMRRAHRRRLRAARARHAAAKDTRLALEAARAAGVRAAPGAGGARGLQQRGRQAGHAGLDDAALLKLFAA